jgi:inorganic pyrophosphatase
MSKKKSYMNEKNILSEGLFDKLMRIITKSKLRKDKKIQNDLSDLNKNVLELEKELNKRFKELNPNHKSIKLSKYKLSSFL